MDSTPFVEAYQELSTRFMGLLNDLSALRALSSLSLSHADETRLLNGAMQVLMENHDLERCSIFLLEGDNLTCATGLDWHDLLNRTEKEPEHCVPRKPMVFRLGQGILGIAAETGRMQHCRNCPEESRFLPPEKQFSAEDTVGSLICMPITLNDKVLGVVNVSHPVPGFFTESHERLLHVFAGFLGQLLSNWRYYHQMEEEVRKRTVELEDALAEAEQLKRRYHQLSIVDELTGLHNRRFFFSEATTALSVAVRHQQPFSVLMVDLDHFKRINDSHGHAMGDRVLQISSTLLRAEVREGDVLARFGGEEFVLALPNTDADDARVMANRILESLRTLQFSADQRRVQVTASIGIASLEQGAAKQPDQLEQLLRQADQALYFGKANGRDQQCSFTDLKRAN